jgi:hypothetical protein
LQMMCWRWLRDAHPDGAPQWGRSITVCLRVFEHSVTV